MEDVVARRRVDLSLSSEDKHPEQRDVRRRRVIARGLYLISIEVHDVFTSRI